MGTRITAFDARSFARASAMALMAGILAWAVMVATDGEAFGSGVRLSRLGALAPVFGAIGSLLAWMQARRRGELVALEGLGVHPLRAHAGALLAAALVGSLGAIIEMTCGSRIEGLFPHVARSDWVMQPDGSWASASLGIGLSADGLREHPLAALPAGAPPAAFAVFAAILAASVVLPVWLVSKPSAAEKVAVAAVTGLGQIGVFHLVGAARVSAWALLAGPAMLGAHWVVRNAELWRRSPRRA
jgi:hypothetical protein